VHSHRLLIRSERAPKNDPIDLNEGDLLEGDERREKEKKMKENPRATILFRASDAKCQGVSLHSNNEREAALSFAGAFLGTLVLLH
jgi:hypothetical protein